MEQEEKRILEEANRRIVSPLADFHFAPTQQALDNIVSEGIPAKDCYLTGNTSIDAAEDAATTRWTSERALDRPRATVVLAQRSERHRPAS